MCWWWIYYINKNAHDTNEKLICNKTCISTFVKNCIFIAQQWRDKQMCAKGRRNCLTSSYTTIHSLTMTIVTSTIGTYHKHFPWDKAILYENGCVFWNLAPKIGTHSKYFIFNNVIFNIYCMMMYAIHKKFCSSLANLWQHISCGTLSTAKNNHLTFRCQIKSCLPFAGIIRRLPYSTCFQDKG